MTERLLRITEVIKQTSLAESTIYKRMRSGEFPSVIKIGGASVWAESEVDEWIEFMKSAN